MPIGVLGTLEVVGPDGDRVEIGGAQPRAVLALLVAAEGRVVPTDTIIDALWGAEAPASSAGTLQTYVSRLRRSLAPADATVVREQAGYRLEVAPADVDMHRFAALVEDGRSALAAGDAEAATALLQDAERLWRGPALLEVRDRPQLAGLARRLDEQRVAAIEDRVTAELELGRHAALVGELAELVTDHPLREGLWALLALARYRAGQQADALRAIADARHLLVEELGVEPGPRLRELEARILDHDTGLDLAPERRPRLATSDPRGELAGDRAPMLGRDAELADLIGALEQASAGGTAVAVVEGEAGVGKTRLVEELAAEATARGAWVVWGWSLEGGAAPAYWPWLNVLRPLREAEPSSVDVAVEQLLDATGVLPTDPASSDRPPLLDGVLHLLTSSGASPLVVVLEDVQWAGPESLELLAQVIASLATGAVLLVLTIRDGDDAHHPMVVAALAAAARRPGTRRIRLGGLAPAATEALVTHVHGQPVDEALARVVHERAGGNPFYAIELVRLLGAEGITDAEALAASPVPLGARDVVRQRLARLPDSTGELLQLAAVAGRDIDVALLSRASGQPLESCLDDLDVALRHRVLVEGASPSGLRFSHALVREVVVDGLSALRRARLHLLVADAIEAAGLDDDAAEILAEHLWAAASIGAGRRAADALDRAAEVAVRRFALRAATDLLLRSLELRRAAGSDLAAAEAELATLISLVRALRPQLGYPGGTEHYARGAELARQLGRHDVELEMLWAEWAVFDTACEFDRARPLAERFRDWAAETDDPLVQLTGFTTWGIQCWHDGDLAASHDSLARAAEARARVVLEPDDLSLAAQMVVISSAFGLYMAEQVGALDDPDAAFHDVAAAMRGSFPIVMTWCFGCASASTAGDLDRVERYARLGLEAETGETPGFWGIQVQIHLGIALVATGRTDEGRAMFDDGWAAYRAAGMRVFSALMLSAAARAEVVAGDLERAARHIEAARAELAIGERYAEPIVLLASADVAEASGGPAADVLRRREEAEAIALAQGAVALAARARVERRTGSGAGSH